MKKILILNGPNLNLLGKRQPEVYGNMTFDEYYHTLQLKFKDHCELNYAQTSSEAVLIDQIHASKGVYNGVVINAGGLAHTSIALADAVRSVEVPIFCVHISNTHIRETYRQNDLLAEACAGAVIGLGLAGYELAVDQLLDEGQT